MQPEERRAYLQYDIASCIPEVWMHNNRWIRDFGSLQEVIACTRFGRNAIEGIRRVNRVPFDEKIRMEVVRDWYIRAWP